MPDAVLPSSGRDRDARGRARNARPRDAAGRPLPRGAPGVEQLPEDLDMAPDEALDVAQRLLDADRPFQAHEVLEGAWKAAPEAQRELWRGLAQLAVGLTHVQRGNPRGSVALLRRAAERIAAWEGPPPYGLDLAGLRTQADTVARLVERAGTGAVAPEQLRVRLRG